MLLDSDGKADVIRSYARLFLDIDSFVETGTGYGDLPWRLQGEFDHMVTIEMDPERYVASRERLKDVDVRVVNGDSGSVLHMVMPNTPAVFWLDAHEDVVGGRSALNRELLAISGRWPGDVILIDDARHCNGQNGWRTIEEIQAFADARLYLFEVRDDIIRLTP